MKDESSKWFSNLAWRSVELFWVFIKRPLFKMKANDNSLHNPELINHRHVSKIMRLVQNITRSIFEDSKSMRLRLWTYSIQNKLNSEEVSLSASQNYFLLTLKKNLIRIWNHSKKNWKPELKPAIQSIMWHCRVTNNGISFMFNTLNSLRLLIVFMS